VIEEHEARAVLDVRSEAVEAVVVDSLLTCVDGGVACAVIDARSPLAHFGRDLEVARFPEFDMAEVMAPFEATSLFIYTVDVDRRRIAHVKRLVRGNDLATVESTGRTGIEVLDDRLSARTPAEKATLEELFDFHGITNPSKIWNIATSCASGRLQPTRSRPYSLFSFKGLLFLTDPIDVVHLFAYANDRTIRGMGRMGIPVMRPGGREFHMPVEGGYDTGYVAIYLHPTEEIRTVLTDPSVAPPLGRPVAECQLPVVVLLEEDEQVIDLTEATQSSQVELVEPVDLDRLDTEVVLDLTGEHEGVLDLTERSASPAPTRERGGA
jgi:hypothetical protein